MNVEFAAPYRDLIAVVACNASDQIRLGCMYLDQEVILNYPCKQMVEIRLDPALGNVSSANAGASRAHSGRNYL